jgi:hypothetical protein
MKDNQMQVENFGAQGSGEFPSHILIRFFFSLIFPRYLLFAY